MTNFKNLVLKNHILTRREYTLRAAEEAATALEHQAKILSDRIRQVRSHRSRSGAIDTQKLDSAYRGLINSIGHLRFIDSLPNVKPAIKPLFRSNARDILRLKTK